MNTWIIVGPVVGSWLLASRIMFRHWWKYDSLLGRRRCPNRYYQKQQMTHHGRCCLEDNTPFTIPALVGLAMIAGLFWPLMVAGGLVVWRRPRSLGETSARIEELETMLGIER